MMEDVVSVKEERDAVVIGIPCLSVRLSFAKSAKTESDEEEMKTMSLAMSLFRPHLLCPSTCERRCKRFHITEMNFVTLYVCLLNRNFLFPFGFSHPSP